jgi:apolipoprotein N-acyltransferase
VPVLLLAFPGLFWLSVGVRSWSEAFFLGWSFSLGFFISSLYWIAFAFTVDLARFFWMIPFAIIGLPAFLSIFNGLVMLFLYLLSLFGFVSSELGRVLVFASLWGLAEWLRGHIMTGFPWSLIGYSWVGWMPALQVVSIIGIYGLSLFTVAVAALPATCLDLKNGTYSRVGITATVMSLVFLVCIITLGTKRLTGTESSVPGVTLRLVQPNISESRRQDETYLINNLQKEKHLSVSPSTNPLTAVIWAESAVPWFLNLNESVRHDIASVAPPGGLLITGAPRAFSSEPFSPVWNSLYALDDTGQILAIYDKSHLVPFGEYIPLHDVLPIERITQIPLDFSNGSGPITLVLPGLPPVSPLICYEAIFPGKVVDDAPWALRPAWLLNITNDGWYGYTAGPYQHFAIVQTRAVEEGLPLARVAYTGISGVVDPYGRIVASLELGKQGIIDVPLPQALLPTVYSQLRDRPFWFLVVGLLLVGIVV